MSKPIDKTTVGIFTLFSVITVLAASAWFFLTHSSKPFKAIDSNIPDHQFTSIHVEQFSKTGQPVYALNSPAAYHLPNEDKHYLTTPHILVTQTKQPAWTIQSKQATITSKGEEITFQNQVIIEHEAYKNTKAGVLKSEELHYFTKKKYASTPLLVTWEQEDKELQAIGMHADLISHHIELLEDVRVHYRPAHG
jgi:lipopolysaccharide export system protein LptC